MLCSSTIPQASIVLDRELIICVGRGEKTFSADELGMTMPSKYLWVRVPQFPTLPFSTSDRPRFLTLSRIQH